MIEISNEDYRKVKRLLHYFQNSRAENLREREQRRQAGLLLRKWAKREIRRNKSL